jgi:hypothetical protein
MSPSSVTSGAAERFVHLDLQPSGRDRLDKEGVVVRQEHTSMVMWYHDFRSNLTESRPANWRSELLPAWTGREAPPAFRRGLGNPGVTSRDVTAAPGRTYSFRASLNGKDEQASRCFPLWHLVKPKRNKPSLRRSKQEVRGRRAEIRAALQCSRPLSPIGLRTVMAQGVSATWLAGSSDGVVVGDVAAIDTMCDPASYGDAPFQVRHAGSDA